MAEIDLDLLPGTLREIAGLIGIPATMKLVDRYGGVRLYVPQKLDASHTLVIWIGAQNAQKLVDEYGGETLEIPKAEAALREIRNREIRSLYPQLSQRDLALKYHTTERNIRLILGECGNPNNQPDLFENANH